MSKFCSLKNVSINWIYLEAGKGKGAADGIGGVIKRAFTDIILQHPDSKFESVTDFLQYLPSYIQNIEIFHFIKEDVMEHCTRASIHQRYGKVSPGFSCTIE